MARERLSTETRKDTKEEQPKLSIRHFGIAISDATHFLEGDKVIDTVLKSTQTIHNQSVTLFIPSFKTEEEVDQFENVMQKSLSFVEKNAGAFYLLVDDVAIENPLDRDEEKPTLGIAVGYSARRAIAEATRKILGSGTPHNVTDETLGELLKKSLPFPYIPGSLDLMIFDNGQRRMQGTVFETEYAEFVVNNLPFHQWTEETMTKAFSEYQARTRKFGGLTSK